MFSIPVKIESIERRKRSIGVLHIIAGFYLIAVSTTYVSKIPQLHWLKVVPYLLVAAGSIVFGFAFKKIQNREKYNYWFRSLQFAGFLGLGIQLFSIANSWTLFSVGIWAALSFFMMLVENDLFQPTSITLVDEGIKIPGVIKSHLLPWNLIDNLVVKKDFVTIFKQDKKFVQLEVAQDVSTNEIENLTTFSKQQIEASTAEEKS